MSNQIQPSGPKQGKVAKNDIELQKLNRGWLGHVVGYGEQAVRGFLFITIVLLLGVVAAAAALDGKSGLFTALERILPLVALIVGYIAGRGGRENAE